jgi:hypothetical protein
MFMSYFLAAIAGWAFDDWCGTPPRPWPGPWPSWQWWSRKILAMIGALIAYHLYHPNFADNGALVSIIVVGGVGGVFLASLAAGAGLLGRSMDRRMSDGPAA